MKRHSLYMILFSMIAITAIRCSDNKQPGNAGKSNDTTNLMKQAESGKEADNGIGKFKNVQLTHPLDAALITKGKPIYDGKCFACHKLTAEKLVGPGWKGVTDRRTPEWIMNFITNTNVMLDSDLIAQKMFITCLVRMPSQGVSDEDARNLLEFMRQNDGKN
ncbi:MAG: cytochrome c [Bacteroidetes bacterium]|nr:cytochrome c [Bacteroidota bacterium]